MSDRSQTDVPAERRMRRRARLGMAKATVAVAVLLVLALAAGFAAVRTIATIANPNEGVQLQRFIDGRDRVPYASPSGRFRAEFPDRPTSGQETVALFVAITARRLVSPVGSDTVELMWFDLPRFVPVKDPAGLLATLAPFLAREVGGSPSSSQRIPGASPPAFEFVVRGRAASDSGGDVTTTSATDISDYYLRAVLAGRRVYVLRVNARRSDGRGPAALRAFVQTFEIVKR